MLNDVFSSASKNKIRIAAPTVTGRITHVRGELIEARGIVASVGNRCVIELQDGSSSIVEVIGFKDQVVSMMPLYPVSGLAPGCAVRLVEEKFALPAGETLCGRVLDGLGKPLDSLGQLSNTAWVSSTNVEINPMHRKPVDEPLDVGIRVINAACAIGCGQRVGLFAGSGVGKSVLLSMMTRYTTADIVIVALVGERGREVREFIEQTLSEVGNANHIVIAATADSSPLMRLKAGLYAAQLSEYFRDEGKRVLLLFDSLTRFAQAQREIALALGEPPAAKGYPASVFSRIPQLVERAGNGQSSGSVTGIYTVLTEGDDLQDPIADSARAILDGHLVLSRELAEEGIYPAIDIIQSISRVMRNVVSSQHSDAALRLKKMLARYESVKELVRIGAYQAGEDQETDMAIAMFPHIRQFLSQSLTQRVTFPESLDALMSLFSNALDPQSATNSAALSNVNPALALQPGAAQTVHQEFNQELATHPSIVGK